MQHNILVVKLGGGAGLDLRSACDDLAQLARTRPVVIVHGVSARMEALCHARGITPQVLTSPNGHTSRYTPPALRDLFVEACASVTDDITRAISAHGVATTAINAPVTICGQRKDALRAVVNGRVRLIRDDYSGSITHVTPAPLQDALARGTVAIVPPLADSPDGLLNIDGDRAAAAVAGALNAETLVILSNVRGLYRDFSDADSLIRHVERHEIERAMTWAQGRMKRKVLGALEALNGGVQRVMIGDGRALAPVTLTLNGEGTVFTR